MGVALHKTQQQSSGFGLSWTDRADDAFYQQHKYQVILFAPCTWIYFCIVDVVITAWVVSYSGAVVILKLNICAYKQAPQNTPAARSHIAIKSAPFIFLT